MSVSPKYLETRSYIGDSQHTNQYFCVICSFFFAVALGVSCWTQGQTAQFIYAFFPMRALYVIPTKQAGRHEGSKASKLSQTG